MKGLQPTGLWIHNSCKVRAVCCTHNTAAYAHLQRSYGPPAESFVEILLMRRVQDQETSTVDFSSLPHTDEYS